MKENNGKTCFPEACSKEAEDVAHCMCVCHACCKKCVEDGNKHTAALCAECADVCNLALKAISCNSQFKDQIMELCGKICEKCAEECKKMTQDHCKECADVCKKCCDCCSECSHK